MPIADLTVAILFKRAGQWAENTRACNKTKLFNN